MSSAGKPSLPPPPPPALSATKELRQGKPRKIKAKVTVKETQQQKISIDRTILQ